MAVFNNDSQIQCPFCGEWIWMEFDSREGQSQSFIVDCEVCCRPIEYSIQYEPDEEEPRVTVRRAQ